MTVSPPPPPPPPPPPVQALHARLAAFEAPAAAATAAAAGVVLPPPPPAYHLPALQPRAGQTADDCVLDGVVKQLQADGAGMRAELSGVEAARAEAEVGVALRELVAAVVEGALLGEIAAARVVGRAELAAEMKAMASELAAAQKLCKTRILMAAICFVTPHHFAAAEVHQTAFWGRQWQ